MTALVLNNKQQKFLMDLSAIDPALWIQLSDCKKIAIHDGWIGPVDGNIKNESVTINDLIKTFEYAKLDPNI